MDRVTLNLQGFLYVSFRLICMSLVIFNRMGIQMVRINYLENNLAASFEYRYDNTGFENVHPFYHGEGDGLLY